MTTRAVHNRYVPLAHVLFPLPFSLACAEENSSKTKIRVRNESNECIPVGLTAHKTNEM